MNIEPRPYVGDVGTIIEVDLQEDISQASSYRFKVKKPSGEVVEWAPTIKNTTTLQYVTASGDLNEAGRYDLQVEITIGSWSGRCNTVSFTVYDLYT
jgi:hypothetical protein